MDSVTESVRADNTTMGELLTALRERIGPQKYNAWFRHGTRWTLEDGCLNVAVPNPFVANWIESHYQGDLATIATEQTGGAKTVAISVDPSLAAELRPGDRDSQADLVNKSTEGRARRRRPAQATPLKHHLKDFVVGKGNQLAYTAATSLADGPGPFNVLFIHGPCGVGKTHLLQGVCNRLRDRKDGGAHVRYVTGEQFTNEFIQAVRNKTFQAFRDRYRHVDVLAIDDIHFLAAKKATQDEFLHTFNAIDTAGKQIVLASDTHPTLVSKFNPHLASRFAAGMVVRLDAPDRETRQLILRRKAESIKLKVDANVLDYIAGHIRGSVRELEGALVKLAALATLESRALTLDLARSALADFLVRTDSALTLSDIESVVAAFFGVTPADLHSSRRTRTVSLARMTVMHLARTHTAMSFPEIGRAMGKNHSSVVLAVQRMQRVLDAKDSLDWPTPAGKRSIAANELVNLLEAELA